MKKTLFYTVLAGLALLILSGCPSPLESTLDRDIVISLGRFNPTANNTLYSAPGASLDVPVTISDQMGRGLSGSYTVAFILSGDADLDTEGDNTDLGDISVKAGSEQLISVDIPGTTAAGAYTLFAVLADGGDGALNNNTAAASVEIGAANLPDLEITSLSTGNDLGGYLPGAGGSLIYTVANNGHAALESGTSFDMTFTFNLSGVDTEVGVHTITLGSALYPGDFITGTAEFTMPEAAVLAADQVPPETADTFTSWSEDLTAEVDSGGVIAESNEGNNTETVTVLSGSAKPELEVESVTMAGVASYAKEGEALEYVVSVRNTGLAVASAYTLTLFVDIDDDGTNNTGDVVLHTWTSAPNVPFDIDGRAPLNNTVRMTVPEGRVYPAVPAGEYYVRAEITDLAEEWDDTNNVSDDSKSVELVFVTIARDLELYTMTSDLTDALPEGSASSIGLTYKIKNNGGDTVETDFDIHFYASDDDTLEAGGDIDLGTDTVTEAVPGRGSLMIDHTVTFPAGAGAGFYTLYCVIDAGDVVDEFDEDNNAPESVDGCFVFFPVSDGTTDIDSRLIVYKPRGVAPESTYISGYFFWDDWVISRGSSSVVTEPGQRAFIVTSCTLTPGETVGLRFFGNNYDRYEGGVPYTFRFVPPYVAEVPLAALPGGLSSEDSFEENNNEESAAQLDGKDNPLTSFVNAYTRVFNWSSDLDFYSLVIP